MRLLLTAGFALLIVQAVSELFKRFAYRKGLIPDPSKKQQRMGHAAIAHMQPPENFPVGG